MNPLDFLDPILDSLTTVKGHKAVVLYLIVFGYVIRMCPWIPNRFIPSINILVLGPFLSFTLLGWPSVGEIDPNCRWPELAAYVFSYGEGLNLGLVSWLGYEFGISKLENFFAGKGASAPVPPQSVSETKV